jgi:hypothetical protein
MTHEAERPWAAVAVKVTTRSRLGKREWTASCGASRRVDFNDEYLASEHGFNRANRREEPDGRDPAICGQGAAQPGRPAPDVPSPPARLLAHMSPSPSHDPIDALNQVLSEVIDMVQDVKQAHVKIPEMQDLHAELDLLFTDLKTWARLLIDQDDVLGVSPLARMPSVAGRTPANLWPGNATDEEVRRIVGEHLDRLEHHVAAAVLEQGDPRSRAVLAEVELGLLAHRRALSEH